MAKNPLQPMFDLLVSIDCTLKKLLKHETGLGDGGTPSATPIIVQPPKGEIGRTYEITIGTTAALIAPRNPKRVYISIVNGGAASVYIGFNENVTATGGQNPGQNLLAQGVAESDTWIGEIWGIVAAGTIVVSVSEESFP